MTISTIGYSFIVNQVQFETLTDTYINIQKRREAINYKTRSAPENVNIGYVQGVELSSDENLTIFDRSTSALQNRILIDIENQIIESSSGFSIETDQFLTTNHFTINLSTQARIPLFFEHAVQYSLQAGEIFSDIVITDENFNRVNSSKYKTDTTEGIVYSNFKNSFDYKTGNYSLYFVVYTVRRPTGVIKKYVEILNNIPIYKSATIDDIDELTGGIIAGRNVYLIEDGLSSSFNIILPTSDDWGIQRKRTSRLNISSPPLSPASESWFVKVNSGKFISEGVTGFNKYYIPEFGVQTFSPYFPYKQADETSFKVTSRIVKTLQNTIVDSASLGFYTSVIVYKSGGSVKFGISSNPALAGTRILNTSSLYSNSTLGNSISAGLDINLTIDSISGSSIDYNGFIVLPNGYEISDTDTIRTIYTYEETGYEYTLFDFNPLFSGDLVNRRIALIIRPETLGTTITESLYYLTINEDGLVIDTNIDFSLTGLGGNSVEDLITVSGLWYDRNPDEVFWMPSGYYNFVRDCSLEGANNQDDILILGDAYTRANASPDSLVINDIRVRGGGYEEGTLWTWDTSPWDGMPFPGAASILIEVPIELVDTVSGVLTANNIYELSKRHIAHGVYPVIHGYDEYTVTVTGVHLLVSGVIQLDWTSGPPDSLYNVYSSLGADTDFTLIGSGLSEPTFVTSGIIDSYYAILGYPESYDIAYIDGPIHGIQKVEL